MNISKANSFKAPTMNKNQTDRAWARAELKNTFGVDTPLREETMTTRLSREQIEQHLSDSEAWLSLAPDLFDAQLQVELCRFYLASLPSEAPTQAGGTFERLTNITDGVNDPRHLGSLKYEAHIRACYAEIDRQAAQAWTREGVIERLRASRDKDTDLIAEYEKQVVSLKSQLAKAAQGEVCETCEGRKEVTVQRVSGPQTISLQTTVCPTCQGTGTKPKLDRWQPTERQREALLWAKRTAWDKGEFYRDSDKPGEAEYCFQTDEVFAAILKALPTSQDERG